MNPINLRCPYCNVRPGKPCVSRSSRADNNYTHKARLEVAARVCRKSVSSRWRS